MLYKNLLLCGLALASFLLTGSWIRSQLPPDPRDEISDKKAYLAEHAPEATALIFGSSAVLHGVVPELVDEIVRVVEPEFRCINAGVSGMRDFEMDKFIREVLRLPGVEPKWIFVQPAEWFGSVSERYRDTDRTLRWHDLRQTVHVTTISLEGLQPRLSGEIDWPAYHLRKFFHRLGNYGQLDRWVRSYQEDSPEPYFADGLLEAGRGYASVEAVTHRIGQVNSKAFLEEIDEYERRVEELSKMRPRPLAGYALKLLRKQRAWLEAQVPHLIYLMPPYPYGGLVAGQLHRDGEAPYCIDFVQPEVYPELYAVEHRFDPYHTNVAGAKILSRHLGERIVEELEKIRADQANGQPLLR